MSLRRRHGFHQAFINLTPLIDMAMMLVVFFVLCLSTSSAALRSLTVALPQAARADAPQPAALEVVLDRGGHIAIDGQPMTLAQLRLKARGSHRASLLADRDCRHGAVVDAVEALRAAGVTEVYYATAAPVTDW